MNGIVELRRNIIVIPARDQDLDQVLRLVSNFVQCLKQVESFVIFAFVNAV